MTSWSGRDQAAGVDIAAVNIMAMDFDGASEPDPSHMGDYAIQAGTALYNQLTTLYPSLTSAAALGARSASPR